MCCTPVPPWWGDVEETRPVVHVTQGRDGGVADLEQLVIPTVRALAGEQVLVVVTTAPHLASTLHQQYRGALPANVRVAEWLPDDQLMPHLAALVTDGSAGSVLSALRHGVPMVVAADSPVRAEMAARVARWGAGMRLRAGRRRPFLIRHAVRQVLDDNRFWAAARRVQAELGRLDEPPHAYDAGMDQPALTPRLRRARPAPSSRGHTERGAATGPSLVPVSP